MTGVNANGDVDVFNQKQIGQKMVESTSGNTVAQFTSAATRRLLFNQGHKCELVESGFKSTKIFSPSAASSYPTLLREKGVIAVRVVELPIR